VCVCVCVCVCVRERERERERERTKGGSTGNQLESYNDQMEPGSSLETGAVTFINMGDISSEQS
jgi:hypothetical protein